MHLIIDGYGSDPKIMQDEQFIHNLLDSYPAKIGMTKIAGPTVFRYVGTSPKDWGISGIVFIAESHISLHTFVERCYINIDVFSCKDFDADQVVKDITDRFRLTTFTSRLVNREWTLDELKGSKQLPLLHIV
ncbi:MAG: S-adenosylmethionine decarboxylase proenzyme [Chloroflexi bacterium]|nr:S-adenosylmethionine decarboxylase proenzyme [Chloroflexota bacterium]MBM3172784.1 S-adenosylmethionine decarboxylase proenzyme [Chloroflexota bacterium]MBM3174502.1 S-adenosylmethionine decarboxylase proenzyme [Chloroflexota bacterium]MBM4449655.1 S-adenosylmethionine decarboxylase proenzyme [Chloroflexota bacterium]